MTLKPDPKVSIIIPVYNGSNFLREAIDSALAQTYNTDNGSTEKIAKSYGSRLKYYKKENGGVASALNFGIKEMAGEYFSWLSHDDMYMKTKIEDQINLLKTLQEDNAIIACNASVLFANGILKKTPINKETFDYFEIFLATSANVGLNGCSLLIPKKALLANKGFNEKLAYTQDYDLWFRMKDKYKFVLLEKYLVVSRRHSLQDGVIKQKACVLAGDKLHSGFLNNLDYGRFEKYFLDNKANIAHTQGNYDLYKTRGYSKTAWMILKNILKYYYEHDKNFFYKLFTSEIEPLTKSQQIDRLGLDKWLDSAKTKYMVKQRYVTKEPARLNGRASGLAKRFTNSLKQDGVFLTTEKIAKKVHARITKRHN
jgi:glycosyltransferase involved in cell wall biosynthesis